MNIKGIRQRSFYKFYTMLMVTAFLSTPVFAEESISRNELMDIEMECIAEKMKNNSSLDWKELCSKFASESTAKLEYMDEEKSRFKSSLHEGYRFSDEDDSEELMEEELEEDAVMLSDTVKLTSEMNMGYRSDNVDWTIAGNINGTSPNILSELLWEDLRIIQIKSKNQLTINDHYVVDAKASYGWIFDGSNEDNDYALDNKQGIFSKSQNNADKGNVLDFSGGLGYKFGLPINHEDLDDLSATILGGYSYHEQNLRMTDGNQIIPSSGSFAGLDSSYDTEWKGPWVGMQLDAEVKSVEGFVRLEYHMADYYAEADWNLRTDFQHPKSFEHEADGDGLVLNVGAKLDLNDRWKLNLDMDYQKWQTDAGIDRIFFSSGTISETRLNEVNWESYAISFGATYLF